MLDLGYKDVAEKYGGNKKKIAEAASLGALGPEGPLLAVMAGMYIDRMRSAQMAEQVPTQTVAQQVLNPQPQAPPQAPQGPPPQGLGALPPPQGGMGAPPQMGMPPEMGMAPPPEEGMMPPEMGMAEGGLTTLPIPDAMFDEPDIGGYAGGGIVAFAPGGNVDYDALAERYWGDIERVESGGRPRPGPMTKWGRAQGVAQMLPDTAKGVARKLGVPFSMEMLTGDSPEAIAYQRRLGKAYLKEGFEWGGGDPAKAAMYYHGGPNSKLHGEKTRAYAQKVLGQSKQDLPASRDFDPDSAAGRTASLEDNIAISKRLHGDLPDSGIDQALAYYKKEGSAEEAAKDKKYDMWATLAQVGASLASGDSPYFLQNVGKAIASALPGAEASKRERQKAERDAMGAMTELYGMKRKEGKEVLEYAKELRAIDMGAEAAEKGRDFQAAEGAKERKWRSDEDEKARKANEAVAKLRQNPSDMESAIVILQSGSPEQKAALEEWLKLRQKYAPAGAGAGANAFSPFGQQGGAPAGNAIDFSSLK